MTTYLCTYCAIRARVAVAAVCRMSLDQASSPSALRLGDAECREPSGPSCQDGADAAAAAAAAAAGAEGSGSPTASGRSSGPAVTPTTQVQLRFGSVLGRGRDGTVWSGVFNGQNVAIKVYGWEEDQVDTFVRETEVYEALVQLQGSVVPKEQCCNASLSCGYPLTFRDAAAG